MLTPPERIRRPAIDRIPAGAAPSGRYRVECRAGGCGLLIIVPLLLLLGTLAGLAQELWMPPAWRGPGWRAPRWSPARSALRKPWTSGSLVPTRRSETKPKPRCSVSPGASCPATTFSRRRSSRPPASWRSPRHACRRCLRKHWQCAPPQASERFSRLTRKSFTKLYRTNTCGNSRLAAVKKQIYIFLSGMSKQLPCPVTHERNLSAQDTSAIPPGVPTSSARLRYA